MSDRALNPVADSEAADYLQHLAACGKIDESTVANVRRSIQDSRGSLLDSLRASGVVDDDTIASTLCDHFRLTRVQDEAFEFVDISERKISIKFLKASSMCPVSENDTTITVAVCDPSDTFSTTALSRAFGKPIAPVIGTPSQIEKMIERLYESSSTAMSTIVESIDEDNDLDNNVERLIDLASETPVVRLVNVLISRAVEMRASDIHIEPFENRLLVRYRIDGVLKDMNSPPVRSTPAVISRLKIMASLDIAERRLPQDGRIQIRAQGKPIDLRVSTVPTMYGESVVLRILDKEALPLDFEKIGFDSNDGQAFIADLHRPHGILLVTGPTGSGKTTTLYAALNLLNQPERKILTVEDPVEYQLEGINQIQVKPQINLTFANALRSIVRQDPDIIMVGEMRDIETASIAVQSALTGHTVFSTLHTNDAGSSITRLLDMGVEKYLLTSTLNGILAQRLVRQLCATCKELHPSADRIVAETNSPVLGSSSDLRLYRARGCEDCANTGYNGRTVIYEYLSMNDDIRNLVLEHADATRLQSAATEVGMRSMRENGFRKAARGVTSVEEILRVTQMGAV